MTEPELFDARLEAAVHAFADRAQTRVDAVVVAERAARRRRVGVWTAFGRTIPVPIALLILLAMLLAALSALSGGAPWDRWSVEPVPAVGPVATATPAPTATASPAATTDGTGDEVVAGTETLTLVERPAEGLAGDVLQLRGGVVTVTTAMNDPRVTGLGTWTFDADLSGAGRAGPIWGPFRLEAGSGAWEGTCRGEALDRASAISGTCWLAGSGAYAGSTYFRWFSWNLGVGWDGGGTADGVIYPGSPPVP